MTTRRRFIAITGAIAGMALGGRPTRAGTMAPFAWQGTALGARARISLYHPDRAEAERLIGVCLDEIVRLERVFSLYRPDSALVRLNRDGRLSAPPFELLDLLGRARWLHEITEGAFDVTVQPLWQLYAAHFARPDADPAGPPAGAIEAALDMVDQRRLAFDPSAIRLRAGMAVTLNGIAQGHVTDRVADLLRAAGMEQVLLDLGEIRALGPAPGGHPWRVGLADPRDPTGERPAWRPMADGRRVIELFAGAIATSSPNGTRFDLTGRHHHLFDPTTGRSARTVLQVTVRASTATVADGLSTALAVLAPEQAPAVMAAAKAAGASEAWLILPDGRSRHVRV